MKKRINLLKIISALFILIIVAIASLLINGHYFKFNSDITSINNNWMSYLKDEVKINDIVIPGSHDAGTYNTCYLGRTQGYKISEQLKMGVRYFDLRVNKTDRGYYLYHEFFNGEEFISVINDLVGFIKQNPSETLILDFQHFKGDSQYDVVEFVEEYFVNAHLVIKNETSLSDLEFISNLTLKEARGKCIILMGHYEEIVSKHNFLFSRNNDSCSKENQVLNSCYISEYNKMKSAEYIKRGLPYYFENIQNKINKEKFKGLFVLQGQLTDGLLIFGPYSKEKKHHENMTKYIKDLKNDPEKLELINIIMRDFLTSYKCDDIITLNYYKGNIQESKKSEFNIK